jgi:hypothetical protein
VETVIALTILLWVVMAAFNLVPSTWLAVKSGEEKIYVQTLAQSKLDQARMTMQPVPTFNLTHDGTLYTCNVTAIANATQVVGDPNPPNNLYLLTCQISWPAQRGVQSYTRTVSACKLPR